jgi:hypothetical protein
MKYIIIAVTSIFLSGCYQTVNLYDIDRAIVVCGSKENIVQITAFFIGAEEVLCRNGEGKNLNGVSAQK